MISNKITSGGYSFTFVRACSPSPATSEHHIFLGCGVNVAGVDINFALEYTPLNELESDDSNSFAMDRDSGADNGYRVTSGLSMFTGFLSAGYSF